MDWASQTCTLTFETVGLWGEGGGLQTTARCPQVCNLRFNKTLNRSFGAHLYPFLRHENLVAGGDAGGRLRMASVVHGQQVGEHEYGREEGMPGVVVMLVIFLLMMLVSDLFEEQIGNAQDCFQLKW